MNRDVDIAIATALALAAYVVLVWAVEVWR
jgi:hypothetical protein